MTEPALAAPDSKAACAPPINRSEMYWHECASKHGKKYHIGVNRAKHPGLTDENFKDLFNKAAAVAAARSAEHPSPLESVPNETVLDANEVEIPGGGGGWTVPIGTTGGTKAIIRHTTAPHPIYWPYAGNNDDWERPVQRVRDSMDIQWYSLSRNVLGWFDIKLRVDITQPWNYRFYDNGPGDEQDSYTLHCWTTGELWVCYDSDHPDIVRIDAWD